MGPDFEIIAKTFTGLEEVLAQEILKIGGRNIKKLTRAVEFTGDIGTVYKANLKLRTAVKILVSYRSFNCKTQTEYYNRLTKFEWEDLFDVSNTFVIDTVATGELFKNSMFAGQRAKDAIVDRFRKKYNRRPSVSKEQPDIRIHIHISHRNQVSVSLDSSGDLLFKRGYKTGTGYAPLNEVLAAGILQLTDWDKKSTLLDPMCGSGTLLIEAALMAGNIPPGIFRSSFGFKNWRDFDKDLYMKIRDSLLDKSHDPHGKFIGFDIDLETLKKAETNIDNAAMEDFIEVREEDFFTSKRPEGPLWLIFNPPYNQRLGTDPDFYRRIGDTLKHEYQNSKAWFITADLEGLKNVGLKTSRRIPMLNGDLECRLVNYTLYEGSKKQQSKSS